MSILACLIGILTLMISVSMQANELNREDRTQEEMDRALRNRAIEGQFADIRREIDAIDKMVAGQKSSALEMQKLMDRERTLLQQLNKLDEDLKKYASADELRKKAKELKGDVITLERNQPSLAGKVAELKKLIAERKKPSAVNNSVVVKPGGTGSGSARNAYFVECSSKGITLIAKGKKPVSVPMDAISNHSGFGAFLKQVQGKKDSMVIFLIRRSGNEAYLWAANRAEELGDIRTGKLPIPKDGPIDLSSFGL